MPVQDFKGTVTGSQVAFPAIQVPNAGANVFDDYEEDTFTPVIADAASGGNVAALGASAGVYTKIGNVVYASFSAVDINTTGMTAGNSVYMQNLPFTARNLANLIQVGAVFGSAVTLTTGALYSYVGPNSTVVIFKNLNTTGSHDPLLVSDLASGTADLYCSITYVV